VRLLLIATLAIMLSIAPSAVQAQHDTGHHDDGGHHDSDSGHQDSGDQHDSQPDSHTDNGGQHQDSGGSHDAGLSHTDASSSVQQQDASLTAAEPVHLAADTTSEVTGTALPGVCGDSPELLATLALPITAQLRLACHWPDEAEIP
jgi:hypothetical protein